MKLGFAVKVLGVPGLKSNDSRRWQSEPHLRVSLGYVREILEYLHRNRIQMYRMSSDIAPYLTHPELTQFHRQIEECSDELADIGETANRYRIRLSLHPSQYIVLNSPDEGVAAAAQRDLDAQARLLDAMHQGPEAVVVTHVGGIYGDKDKATDRFIRGYEALTDTARSRLVVENDESSYSVMDVMQISRRTGVRVVFDYLHHMNHDPERMEVSEAVAMALDTWPEEIIPKVHFSSPRTELREVERKNSATGRRETEKLPPLLSQHSDFINPFEFATFLRQCDGMRDFDIMLEAKAKDLALLRLCDQMNDLMWMLPSSIPWLERTR